MIRQRVKRKCDAATAPVSIGYILAILIFVPAHANESSFSPIARAQNIAPSSSGLDMRKPDVLPSVSQNENSNSSSTMNVPENLRYIFDLPWCTRWRFRCMSCEKKNGAIRCFDSKESCHETFSYYRCEQHNLPRGCVIWNDGCNSCGMKSGEEVCTLKSCEEYLAPNKPSFECLRYESTDVKPR
jgi:hypothetical protein